MRLAELDPRWWAEPGRHGQGISFLCPHCVLAGAEVQERIPVPFSNPLDGGTPNPAPTHWARTGDSFETLTLSPSVDASAHGHWHGFITDGAVR